MENIRNELNEISKQLALIAEEQKKLARDIQLINKTAMQSTLKTDKEIKEIVETIKSMIAEKSIADKMATLVKPTTDDEGSVRTRIRIRRAAYINDRYDSVSSYQTK